MIKYCILVAFWFLYLITSANAGPIGVAISAVVGFLGSGTIIAQIVGLALMTAAKTLLARAFGKKEDNREPGIRTQLQVGGTNPLSFLVGYTATAGQLEYVNTWGKADKTENAYITLVISLSDIPITALLPTVWIAGEKHTIDFASVDNDQPALGNPIVGLKQDGRYYGWVRFHDGTQTVADTLLTNKFSGDPDRPWSADMIGTGIAYVVVTLRLNRAFFTGSVPNMRFETQGIKLYNPAKDSTNGGVGAVRWNDPATWEYEDDNASAIYNITRGVHYDGTWIYGGQNLPQTLLPSATWIAGYNECELDIPLVGGGTEKQFRCGYEVIVSQEPLSVIERFLDNCNGRMAEIGGFYKIKIGAPGPAVYTFTDGDIVATHELDYDPFPGIQQTFNGVHARYPEPGEAWELKDAPPYYSSEWETEDENRRLVAKLDLDTTFSNTQVQRVVKAAAESNRRFRRHIVPLPPEAAVIEPAIDTVAWNSEREGYAGKEFIVLAATCRPGMINYLQILEIDPADYDWTPATDQKPYSVGYVGTVRPPAQPSVGWSVEPYILFDSSSQARRPTILVEFPGDLEDIKDVKITVRLASDESNVSYTTVDYGDVGADNTPKFVTLAAGPYLPVTAYEAQGQFVSYSGRIIDPTPWMLVITDNVQFTGDDLAPGSVSITKFADGITPVELLPAVPSNADPANFEGRQVYNTTTGIMWTFKDGAWQELVAGDVLDGSITSAKIADAAVIADKLATDAVTAVKIAADAVTAAKIATGAVETGKIADLAITNAKLGALAVDAAKLAANAVTSVKIADGAVINAKLGALAVDAAKLAANAVTETKIADNAVTTPKLIANAVVADKIASNAIHARHLIISNFDNLVPNPQFASGTLDDWYVNAGSGSVSIVSNVAFPTNNMARFDGTGGSISMYTGSVAYTTPGAGIDVVPGEEYIFSITSAKSHVGITPLLVRALYKTVDGVDGQATVISPNPNIGGYNTETGKWTVPAGATKVFLYVLWPTSEVGRYWYFTNFSIQKVVGSTVIQDGAITTVKIAALAVTAATIAANAITSEKITANAVVADKIAVNAIATRHLIVSNFDNLAVNGDFAYSDLRNWFLGTAGTDAAYFADNYMGGSQSYVWLRSLTGADVVYFNYDVNQPNILLRGTSVVPGEQYHISAEVRGDGVTGTPFITAYVIRNDGTSQAVGVISIPTGTFAKTTVSGSVTMPANAARMLVRITISGPTASTSNGLGVTNIIINKRQDANLIVDGAIVADKIATNAITSTKIAANAVTAVAIAAGTITGAKIAGATITGDLMVANSITSREITITNFENLIPNPNFLNASLADWYLVAGGGTNISVTTSAAFPSGYAMRFGGTGTTVSVMSGAFHFNDVLAGVDCSPGDEFYLGLKVIRSGSGHVTPLDIYARYTNTDGTQTNVLIDSAPIGASGWIQYGGTVTIPALARKVRMYINCTNQATGAVWFFTNATMYKRKDANLIVDGAITAGKIAANAVTSGTIAANAITAGKVAAGAIGATQISVTSLSAIEANMGAITAGTITFNASSGSSYILMTDAT